MKKLFSLVLTFIIALTSMSNIAFAERVGENGILGVITNAEGDIVEYVFMPMSRQSYVDSGITLEAGESFTSYQYEPNYSFSAGISFVGRYDNIPTTKNRKIRIDIYNSDSIGGQRRLVKSKIFSTNPEDNDTSDSPGSSVTLDIESISTISPYYNAKITNISSSSAYVNILIGMD